mmetsp:Transcript_126973/g.367551  ORF Transcript_126973/g.367551 Transcript_126973/m.367551 type:complete len:290 (-) Transcript_126973:1869-2738(-)
MSIHNLLRSTGATPPAKTSSSWCNTDAAFGSCADLDMVSRKVAMEVRPTSMATWSKRACRSRSNTSQHARYSNEPTSSSWCLAMADDRDRGQPSFQIFGSYPCFLACTLIFSERCSRTVVEPIFCCMTHCFHSMAFFGRRFIRVVCCCGTHRVMMWTLAEPCRAQSVPLSSSPGTIKGSQKSWKGWSASHKLTGPFAEDHAPGMPALSRMNCSASILNLPTGAFVLVNKSTSKTMSFGTFPPPDASFWLFGSRTGVLNTQPPLVFSSSTSDQFGLSPSNNGANCLMDPR